MWLNLRVWRWVEIGGSGSIGGKGQETTFRIGGAVGKEE